jgi:hypothetical protein
LAAKLSQEAGNFAAVALAKVAPRNYRKKESANEINRIPLQAAA